MTIELLALFETEETLTLEPEAERRYQADIDSYRAKAAALLASVRHLMTGREIEACENALAPEGDGFNAGMIDALANQFPREAAAI